MTASVTPIHEARNSLSYALRYINLGWWVLPLDPGTKKPLGRLVHNGFHGATNEAEIVQRWWDLYPDAGIGVALPQSGLVAVDIDPRNGGLETIDQLESQHGAIDSDVIALTGGGGEHRVFVAQLVQGLPGKLGPGVDLKADGYIAVEPTMHPSGKRYEWEASSDPLDGVVPSTLPNWIRDLGREKKTEVPQIVAPAFSIHPKRLRDLEAALAIIRSDDRETWLRVGAAIHNEIPSQQGFDIWTLWSQASSKFDAKDQLRVWRSFERRGLSGVGLNSVFAIAQQEGWKNRINAIPSAQPSDRIKLLGLGELKKQFGELNWLVKHVIPDDSIGVLFGGPGTFKSFISLDLALHVAHGLNWLGRKTTKGTVVFVAAEGGTGLWKRIQAWHQARGLRWEDIEFYVVPLALDLVKDAQKVAEAAKKLGITPDLVIVDTLSQTFSGQENDASEISVYLRELQAAFRETWHCSILVIHHSGHAATERPRGSSAIRGNVDFMLGVFRDEKEMLATLECHKQKDGELFHDITFTMSLQQLGHDEDGDAVTSLVAGHVNSAEALIEAHKHEGSAGRGGRNHTLMQLVHNGMTEKDLRMAFYDQITDIKDPHNRKVAFYRARDWAVRTGFFEVAGPERRLIVLKEYNV